MSWPSKVFIWARIQKKYKLTPILRFELSDQNSV